MKQHPRLFDEINAPYYVYAPSFTNESGGIRAMHQLCHALNLMGEEAYVTTSTVSERLRTPTLTNQLVAIHNAQKRKPIVIYPEVINDNPFKAEYVVRYLLNIPGFLNNGQLAWGATDLIYAHGTDVIPPRMEAALLQLPLVDTHIYNTVGVDDSQRVGNLVFINRFLTRGGQFSPVTEGCTEISFRVGRRSPEQLAQLYRSAKLLYSYEASTACYEALLCGCPVVYLPNNVMLPKPMHHYLKDAGSAWGNSPEQIDHARRTLCEVPVIYEELHQGFWRELEEFIDVTQQRVRGAKAVAAVPTVQPAQTEPSAQVSASIGRRRVVVLSAEPIDSAGSVARMAQPFALAEKDWQLVWGVEKGEIRVDEIRRADLIVLQDSIAVLLPVESLKQIFGLDVPVVYDAGAGFEPALASNGDTARVQPWQASVEYAVRHARAVLVASESRVGAYRVMTSTVHVVTDKVDFDLFRRTVRENPEPIHLAVAGASLEAANFALLDQALREIDARYGKRVRLTFIGASRPDGWGAHAADFVGAHPTLADYAQQVRELDIDIALIPRADASFNAASFTRPLLEFAAAGAAILSSAGASSREVLRHGQTGLLVGDSGAEWLDAIVSVIETPALRRQLARTAQAEVSKRHALSEFPSDLQRALLAALGVQLAQRDSAAQEILPGVLILDRDGDAGRVDATLRSLEASPLSDLMAIVFTTQTQSVPEWTTRLRYVKASPAEYAPGLETLCALTTFDWSLIVEAGNALHA